MIQRQSEINPLIKQMQLIFYNDLVNLALDENNITTQNIDAKIKSQIKITLAHILTYPQSSSDTMILPTGTKLSRNNCPTIYLGLFDFLLNIRNTFNIHEMSSMQITSLENNLRNNQVNSLLERKITELSENVLKMKNFIEMIPEVKKFILEAKGITPFQNTQHFIETGISLDLIRSTFYNEMVNQTIQAVNKGWITIDDLQCQEAYIFFALPALTLIEAINQSKNCDGIRLLDNKLLTIRNCPGEAQLAELFIPILTNKSAMAVKSEIELEVIKQLCLAKDTELPSELLQYKNSEVTECAAIINEVASQISRRGVFKETVMKVINVCLETLEPIQQQANYMRP